MLYEILKHIRNFFPDLEKQKTGKFVISNNTITPAVNELPGQYFLIENSAMNDGVHRALDTFVDETFEGTITPLKIPKDFLALVQEIEDYNTHYKATPYQSESFGGYSYSKGSNGKKVSTNWTDAFGTRLNAWRKL